MGVTGPAQGQPEGQRQEPFVGSLTPIFLFKVKTMCTQVNGGG